MSVLFPDKKISVVMATFNGEKYLEEQLLSILSQTRPPDSIIICDDLSTDRTPDILAAYHLKYPVITYEINRQRLGVVGNFKKAVSLAIPGSYVALSDQDDIWLPGKLEAQIGRMISFEDNERPAIVYSDLCVIDKDGHTLNNSFWNELGHDGYEHCFETLLFGNFVTGCTVLMNHSMRRYFTDMPGDVLMHDAWLALIAFTFGNVSQIEMSLVLYRRHGSNVAYSASYKKPGRLQKTWRHFKRLVIQDRYLKSQIGMVEKFAKQYALLLNVEQASAISKFLSVLHSSYFRERIVFSSMFAHRWKPKSK